MNEQKLKGMLWGAIIGDALGTPLDGLTKAHIHSVFKTINNYTDTTKALKGKPESWKKSGLYSAMSQLMILLAMCVKYRKRFSPHEFSHFISDILKDSGNESGIFRHPSQMIKNFIHATKTTQSSSDNTVFSYADASGAVIMAPFSSAVSGNESHLEQILSFSLIFNKDIHSTAGNLLFSTLLGRILDEKNITDSGEIPNLAIETATFLLTKLENLSGTIFNLGLNPDYLLSSLKDYIAILEKLINVKNIEAAEKNIYTYVNTKLKTPVTRATINHPLAIIPFAIYLCFFHSTNPFDTLFRAAEYGGSSSILCALTGALNGALSGADSIPEILMDELVNKRKIGAIMDNICKEKITDELIQEFISGEASLSTKELQEKDSKLKHVKVKTKKKKSRHEMEKELSGHIVESWTKFDKAKWRRKLDQDKNNE